MRNAMALIPPWSRRSRASRRADAPGAKVLDSPRQLGEGSAVAQQNPEALDARPHAGGAQRAPEQGERAADDGLAEVLLERLDHAGRRQPRPTQQDAVSVGRVGRAGERVGALLALRVDALD